MHPSPTPNRETPIDALVASLGRRTAGNATIDHVVGPAPPGSDVAERAAWIVARRRTECEELGQDPRGIELTAGR